MLKKQKCLLYFEQLNKYTIIEFKSPRDRLEPGDFDKLRVYGLLYKLQKDLEWDSDITIITVSSTLPDKYKRFTWDRYTTMLSKTILNEFVLFINKIGI